MAVPSRPFRNRPNGYALLLVMFFLALIVVGMTAVTPNVFTTAQREKEQEMIWRGRQYVRGVRLYYQKTHHLPSRLEDLYLPKTGVRFMRQAYKDPMNPVDGSWRLIYVAPNGQIIGSLNQHQNMFYFGGSPASGFAGSLGNASANLNNSMTSGNPNSGAMVNSPFPDLSRGSTLTSGLSSLEGTPTLPDASSNVAQANGLDPSQNQQPVQALSSVSPSTSDNPDSSSQTFGQTIIIGVGSKVNKSSIQKLDGASNYLHFEFIWNGNSSQTGTISH